MCLAWLLHVFFFLLVCSSVNDPRLDAARLGCLVQKPLTGNKTDPILFFIPRLFPSPSNLSTPFPSRHSIAFLISKHSEEAEGFEYLIVDAMEGASSYLSHLHNASIPLPLTPFP